MSGVRATPIEALRGAGAGLILVALFFGAPALARAEEPRTKLTVLVPPVLHPDLLVRRIDGGGTRTPKQGTLDVSLRVCPSYRGCLEDVLSGNYQIATLTEMAAAVALSKTDTIPILFTEMPGKVMIIAKRDSEIHTLQDLAGQRVAAPGPFSINHFVGHQVLQRVGLDSEQEVEIYSPETHDWVLLDVLGGEAKAGVVAAMILHELSPELQASLRSIAEISVRYRFIALAHPSIPAAVREEYVRNVLRVAASPAARGMSARVQKDAVTPEVMGYLRKIQADEEVKAYAKQFLDSQ